MVVQCTQKIVTQIFEHFSSSNMDLSDTILQANLYLKCTTQTLLRLFTLLFITNAAKELLRQGYIARYPHVAIDPSVIVLSF